MISIAMATYNGAKYLGEQLDSILSQTEQDFEVIVCDDCSTDDGKTAAILNEYADKDARLKIYFNEENLGFKKNFEKACYLCTGDYIALCDQDDIWLPNHLEILLQNIDGFDLCGANAILVDENNNEMGKTLVEQSIAKNIPTDQKDLRFMLLHKNIFQGAAIMFKKELLDNALPIPPENNFHDLWLSAIATEHNGAKYVNIPIIRYRQHSSTVTKRLNIRERLRNTSVDVPLDFLVPFKAKTNDPDSVQKAIDYFNNVTFGNPRFIPYYLKNYYKIYLNRNFATMILRMSKWLFRKK